MPNHEYAPGMAIPPPMRGLPKFESEYIPGNAIPRFSNSKTLENAAAETVSSGLEKLRRRATESTSQNLPENPYSQMDPRQARAAYREQLDEYEVLGLQEKTDFRFADDPNVGWKLHVNVTPEHVKEVSRILSEAGYRHKFLKAGSAEDGKVFTIYIGSRRKTETEALQISDSLKGLLAKPISNTELEFASGVVGRFTTKNPHSDRSLSFRGPNRTKFHHYGTSGFVWLMNDMDAVTEKRRRLSPEQFNDWYSKEKPDIELRAYRELTQEFGDYFTGE